MVPDPHGPIPRGKDGRDLVGTKPLMYGETDNWNVAETVDAFGRGQPQVTFSVFESVRDGITRQAICGGKMIRFAIVNSVDAASASRNPQCVVPIQSQAINMQFTSVEFRRDERFPGSIYQVVQTKATAGIEHTHPHRSIGSEGEVRDTGQSCFWF
jgi:hypothetical protein